MATMLISDLVSRNSLTQPYTKKINISESGQPDYTLQWIKYYQNLGMHEQANLIIKNLEKKA